MLDDIIWRADDYWRLALQIKRFDIVKSTLKKRTIKSFRYMAARKKTALKRRLIKRTMQNKAVPAWVIIRTHRHVKTNPKRRMWRRTDVAVG